MSQNSLIAIARALQDQRVRSVIAGGLAVVAHGHVPFTPGVSLLLDMDPDNLQRALEAFSGLGYRPRLPVPLAHFADPVVRETWMRERHMKVFPLWNPDVPRTEVDLFVASPLDFERAYAAGERRVVGPDVEATFVGLEDLLQLEAAAGRRVGGDDVASREEPPMTGDGVNRPAPEAPWDVDWESHARAQRLRMAELPMTEKLRWLEEAHELTLTLLGEAGFRLARERRVGPLAT